MSAGKSAQKRIDPAIIKWGSIVAIVLLIILYALITGRQIEEIEIPGYVRVRLIDQTQGPTEYSRSPKYSSTPTGDSSPGFSLQIPGEGLLPFKDIDRFVIRPGRDDSQGRHLSLVARALESGETDKRYDERDEIGLFSLWLNTRDFESGALCYSYTTLLREDRGDVEAAFRLACKEGNEWVSRISPTLLEMLDENSDIPGSPLVQRPEILSIGKIQRCLTLAEPDIARGHITPHALVNRCFVTVPILPDHFARAERGELLLGKELGLTFDAAYNIADFGYKLYQSGEYIGSRTFFQAMVLLNSSDAYFHNMVGTSFMGLGRFPDALNSFDKAIKNNAEYVHALLNRADTLLKLGQPGKARGDLEAVVRLDDEPGFPSAQRARQLLARYY